MKNMGKISTFQLFAILFLCRIINLFTFMLPTASYLNTGDKIIVPLFVALTELIFSAIIIRILSKNHNEGLIPLTKNTSRTLGKILSILYAFCFVWFAGLGVARFELFISTVMFPNSELYFMTILLIVAAFYASLKGIEAIGRASGIIFTLLCVSTVFIVLTVLGEFRYTFLKPILTEGIAPVMRFALYIATRTSEIITLYVISPQIKGNRKKMLYSWVGLFAVITVGIMLILTGVTGEYGDDQIFQLYTLTVIAKFGIFERLDDVLTGIWVLCCFIQSSFLIFSSVTAIEQGFGKIKKVPVSAAVAVGIFTVYILSSKTVTFFSEIASSPFQDIVFFSFTLFLPILSVFLNFLKKRRKI